MELTSGFESSISRENASGKAVLSLSFWFVSRKGKVNRVLDERKSFVLLVVKSGLKKRQSVGES